MSRHVLRPLGLCALGLVALLASHPTRVHAGVRAFDGNWVALDTSATTPPYARREYAAIYDVQRDRYLIFAGRTSTPDTSYVLFDQVWTLTLGPTPQWSQLAIPGPVPGQRHSPQWGYDPAQQRLIVFGGYGSHYPGDPYAYLDDVWQLSLDGTPAWTELFPNGVAPSGRLAGAAAYDPLRQRFVGFGGTAGLPTDTWELDLAHQPVWQTIPTDSSGPPGGYGMTCIYDEVRDRMITFGGSTSDNYYGVRNDVWALDLTTEIPTWSKLAPDGAPPIARRSGTAIYDPRRDRMVIFGGWDGGDSLAAFLGDSWALSLSGTPTWTQLAPTGGTPVGRDAMAAAYDPVLDRMVVYGGWSGASFLDDTWFLDWGTPGTSATLSPSAATDSALAMLDWQVGQATGSHAAVYRRQTGTPWSALATVDRDAGGAIRLTDNTVAPGQRYGYLAVITSEQGETFGGEVWVDVASTTSVHPGGPAAFALDAVRPNPVVGRLTVSFVLPDAAPARVDLLDVAGRLLRSRDVGAFGAGRHQVELGGAGELRHGLYFIRLTRAGRTASTRVVIGG